MARKAAVTADVTAKGGKAKTTALVPWSEKFAAYAKQSTEQVKDIGATGVSVAFGHNDIKVAGKSVGKTLQVIILGSTPHNRWFSGAYNKDEKQPPTCYAFAPLDPEHPGMTMPGSDPATAPHPMVKDKQASTCAECEKNAFGSATTGNGKACANTIRLGLLLANDATDGEAAKAAEIATAHISPTNQKHYAKYVDLLKDEYGRPPWAVVTEITSHDDSDTQIRLEFKVVDPIEDDDILIELEKRFLKVQDVLQVPYSAPSEKKPTATKKAVGAGRKFVGKGR